MSGIPPEDRCKLWPALAVGGVEIALEVEVHGAWIYENGRCRYEAPNERSEATQKAMRTAFDVLAEHRRKQQEGRT